MTQVGKENFHIAQDASIHIAICSCKCVCGKDCLCCCISLCVHMSVNLSTGFRNEYFLIINISFTLQRLQKHHLTTETCSILQDPGGSQSTRGREHSSTGPVFLFMVCDRHCYSYMKSALIFNFSFKCVVLIMSSGISAHDVVQLHSILEKIMEYRLRIGVTRRGGNFPLILFVFFLLFSLV